MIDNFAFNWKLLPPRGKLFLSSVNDNVPPLSKEIVSNSTDEKVQGKSIERRKTRPWSRRKVEIFGREIPLRRGNFDIRNHAKKRGKFHGSFLSSKESPFIRELIVKNRRNLYISLSFKFIGWKIVINERKVRTRIDNNAIYHYYCYYYYYCYYPENLPLRPSIHFAATTQQQFNEPYLVINNRQSNIKLILKRSFR